MAKAGVALGDIYSADIACPIIDVAEKLAVSLLEIVKVVWREGKLDFTGSQGGNLAFRTRQQVFVVDIEAVAQYLGVGVAIGVLSRPVLVETQAFTLR